MNRHRTPITILMADDDPDDVLLTRKAFNRCRLANELNAVEDGEELMDYLHRRGKYADPDVSPRPGLILLDINMPRNDGREALREIKADPELRQIPVIVLSTSNAEQDILRGYDSSANSYITKPVTFEAISNAIRCLPNHWLEIVTLMPDAPATRADLPVNQAE